MPLYLKIAIKSVFRKYFGAIAGISALRHNDGMGSSTFHNPSCLQSTLLRPPSAHCLEAKAQNHERCHDPSLHDMFSYVLRPWQRLTRTLSNVRSIQNCQNLALMYGRFFGGFCPHSDPTYSFGPFLSALLTRHRQAQGTSAQRIGHECWGKMYA